MHEISPDLLSFETVKIIAESKEGLSLSEKSKTLINSCRNYLDRILKERKDPIYGINTGFGALYDRSISENDLEKLQVNLVMSHACGTGEEVPLPIVKLMLLLKIQGLSLGKSGVQLPTIERLLDFYNHDILPVIYQQGSLGASGDLAPLAHLSLPLLGMGEVYYQGKKRAAQDVLSELGWKAINLKSKEGLALLNGTQFMGAYGLYCILEAQKISHWADVIAAMSLEAFDGRIEPFNELIQQVRPHSGQIKTAEKIRSILKDSQIISQPKKHVQDPYSFRCIPQVHGASKDTIDYVQSVILTEINSVTDNPTIFPEEDLIISAGNFHGQPLALALDFLGIAIAELGSISERRTFQLISGSRNLPPFLVANPGLNSGMMIPQYTAASIVSQNKQLCSPSSIDSIVSSNGQEDHVSMGANSATKTYKIIENLWKILAIELMNAAQGLEFRKDMKSSPFIEELMVSYRKKVTALKEDRILSKDIEQSILFLKNSAI